MSLFRNGGLHDGGAAKVSCSILGDIENVNFRIVCSFISSVVCEMMWLSEFAHEM